MCNDPDLFGEYVNKEVKAYNSSDPNHYIVDCRFQPHMVQPNAIWVVEDFHGREHNDVAPGALDYGLIILNVPNRVLIVCCH